MQQAMQLAMPLTTGPGAEGVVPLVGVLLAGALRSVMLLSAVESVSLQQQLPQPMRPMQQVRRRQMPLCAANATGAETMNATNVTGNATDERSRHNADTYSGSGTHNTFSQADQVRCDLTGECTPRRRTLVAESAEPGERNATMAAERNETLAGTAATRGMNATGNATGNATDNRSRYGAAGWGGHNEGPSRPPPPRTAWGV